MERRVFLLVIDGFGVGEAPDAYKFGDEGSNTFKNIYNAMNLNIPNLRKLGLTSINGLNIKDDVKKIGSYGKLQEKSVGKDTTTGHFEMMKIISSKPMPTYPNAFPSDMIEKLESAWGMKILGNKVASGTVIIQELGEEHLKTKRPIVYTSADSVLQVATHTDVFSLEELYKLCEIARKLFPKIGRIIARPFYTNKDGEFERLNTARKDFSVIPPVPNTMQNLVNNGKDVIAVGKIEDIFANQSITKSFVNHTNEESLEVVKNLLNEDFDGFCFVNLVDTDMLFGHRNDVKGYGHALELIDVALNDVFEKFNEHDYLLISADHGCDPTTPSTDHSREYVPLLIYSKELNKSVNLGTMLGFDNIGEFVEKLLGINNSKSVIYDKLNEEK